MILIAEDNPEVRSSLREWLGTIFPHCTFLEARNGEEAVSLSCVHRPDVVLMDISMPLLGGIEATRRIKAFVPEVQIVIVTVHDEDAYRQDAARAGAAAYVQKAQASSHLPRTLERLLPTDAPGGNS